MIAVVIVVANLANFVLFQQSLIRKKYFKFLNHSFPPTRSVQKRGAPQPRALFYYETVVLKMYAFYLPVLLPNNENNIRKLNPGSEAIAKNAESAVVGYQRRNIEMQLFPVLWLLITPDSYRYIQLSFLLILQFYNPFPYTTCRKEHCITASKELSAN